MEKHHRMRREIIVAADKDELTLIAAEKFTDIAAEAIRAEGRFTVALSGGSTPRALYQMLSNKYAAAIDWPSILFFFGDERNVSPDSLESNYRLANENLFLPLNIDPGNVFRWKTELLTPNEIAREYETTLTRQFNGPSRFDLILLGMGPDGHTASLFPHTKALNQKNAQAVENWVPQLDTWRFTLTFPAINNAKNIIFLVTGEEKSDTLKIVLENEPICDLFPSQCVKPENGKLTWLVDSAGAASLDNAILAVHKPSFTNYN